LKKQEYLIYGALSSLILNIVLDIMWVPKWGATGAAWGTITSYALQLLIVLFLLRRTENQPLNTGSVIAKPALIAGAMTWLASLIPAHGFLRFTVDLTAWILILILLIISQPALIKDLKSKLKERSSQPRA